MSYKFSLRIDRDGHTMAEAVVSVESTTQEITKGKRTIVRLMNEYARAVTLPSAPEEPVLQGPITPTNPAEPEIAQDPPPRREPADCFGSTARSVAVCSIPSCSRSSPSSFANVGIRSTLRPNWPHINLSAPAARRGLGAKRIWKTRSL